MSDYRLLELALEAATSATSYDNGLKYQRAGAGYSKAIKYLSLVMQRHASITPTTPTTTTTRGITPQQIERIKHYHLVYQQRLAGLDSAKTSANSKTMPHTSPHRDARARRTSLSKIPFVEDVVHKTHCPRPPAAIWRRPYWLLKRLQSSVNGNGGFVAPSIYVTGLIWSQKGAKISGLQHKMKIYQNIYEQLTVLSEVQLPSDGKSWRTMHQRDTSMESLKFFEHGLNLFLQSLIKSQNALAHSLSYVHKAEGSVADHKQNVLKRALTKVSKVYDRTANESITKRVSGNDLQQYGALVACLSERAQFLDGWLTYFETPGCAMGKGGAPPPGVGMKKSNHLFQEKSEFDEGEGGGEGQGQGQGQGQGENHREREEDNSTRHGLRASQIEAASSALPRIHRTFEKIGHGLRDAVCLVVWKDLQELCERYLRKTRKSFVANLEWEEDGSNEETTTQSV